MAGNIAEKVADAIRSTVELLDCRIWDAEYVREGSRNILRITIDRDDGIDIDRCEAVHRAIDPVIDELDPIDEPYYLEVSSPGIERELRTDEHFAYAKGQKIDVKLFTAIDGKKHLTGVLNGVEDGESGKELLLDGTRIPMKLVSKCNVHFDFEDL
ncbi:MAG: ribosome maturation factor RimP [Clostridia bacterium]|nr:ribosome maturation factor RimP [Clostridia bacterium]